MLLFFTTLFMTVATAQPQWPQLQQQLPLLPQADLAPTETVTSTTWMTAVATIYRTHAAGEVFPPRPTDILDPAINRCQPTACRACRLVNVSCLGEAGDW